MADIENERERLHALVDDLTPAQIRALCGLMEAMVGAPSASLAYAPFDDEPLSHTDRQAIQAAREWFTQNEGVPHVEAMRRLGLD